jgi:exodeoxyribonuclease VII small subunit
VGWKRSARAVVSKKLSLGKTIDRLEQIVQSLEREELELEEALRLFDEGMELIRVAEREISESEGRLKQVLVDRRGRQRHVDFEPPEQ